MAIGGLDNFRINLFKECDVERVLISYASIHGRQDLKLPFSECMLDSGAYSVETGKNKVSVESYTLWLQLYLERYPQIKHYINLDDLSDPYISMRNQLYMESEGLSPMPVYHYGEPTETLDSLCKDYEYVGLGGMAVGSMPWQKLQKFWEWIYDRYKDNKFHMFGVGTVQPFFYCQPYSIDSTSWNVGSRFGDLMCYRKGLPYRFGGGETDGYKFFFNTKELFANNIRAQVDWEKLEWLKNVKPRDGEQKRLIF